MNATTFYEINIVLGVWALVAIIRELRAISKNLGTIVIMYAHGGALGEKLQALLQEEVRKVEQDLPNPQPSERGE